MATTHVVSQGECLTVIAKRFGLTWQEIWNAPENSAFKKARKNPDLLFPGDVLVIPTIKPVLATLATGKVHTITIKAQPTRLRLHLKINGKPLAGTPFRLTVAGQLHKGNTDGAGLLDVPVPSDAETATLELPKVPFKQQLLLGNLDPVDTLSGAQARLQHLGANTLAATGVMDDLTASTLRAFQEARKLVASGELDPATVAALESEYGC